MFENLVPVNKLRHGSKRIKQSPGFEFAADFHLASLMTHEFVRAGAIYPIVFIEDTENDSFVPVALLGLSVGENLFIGEDGQWQASYIPAIIRRYPFALARTENSEQFSVSVDENSPLLSDDEGQALFDSDGNPTDLLENVKRYLGELQAMDQATAGFARFLKEENMLTPLNLRVREGEGVQDITGCYVLNEERFNNLSDSRFLEFRAKGYLPAVYAHLISLVQIERLVNLHDQRNTQPAS